MTDRILPDTNVLGEIWNPRGLERVKAAFAEVANRVVLSVVVLGETLRGIHQLPPCKRRDSLQGFYDRLVRDFCSEILPVTIETAEAWGRMTAAAKRAGRTLHVADGLIAATALHHDLTLWTRNTRDFEGTGVRLFNPWED